MLNLWIGYGVSLVLVTAGFLLNLNEKRTPLQIAFTGLSIISLLTTIGSMILKAIKVQ